MKNYAAIDPMAMILSEDAFLIWCEIHHPNLPNIEEIKELFKRLTPEQKKLAVSKAKIMVQRGEALVVSGKTIINAGH
jgi:hypothetical protein